MSLLRAGVDMLRSCPAVSLKEKSPVRPPHPPAQRPNHCGSPPPPRLHKQPCNDVSLRRLQIPPPSASTTAGGGGKGRGERARARHRPAQGAVFRAVFLWGAGQTPLPAHAGHRRVKAAGGHMLPRLSPPVASFRFGRTGRDGRIRSLRFQGEEVG
ncbi:hypothetical protein NN561_003762 [Cricetulus griseus]